MSGWIGPKMPTHYIDFAKATPEKPGMSDMEKIVAFRKCQTSTISTRRQNGA
jgi:hypothetical protein